MAFEIHLRITKLFSSSETDVFTIKLLQTELFDKETPLPYLF